MGDDGGTDRRWLAGAGWGFSDGNNGWWGCGCSWVEVRWSRRAVMGQWLWQCGGAMAMAEEIKSAVVTTWGGDEGGAARLWEMMKVRGCGGDGRLWLWLWSAMMEMMRSVVKVRRRTLLRETRG
ncbi:hypothetical protein F0562_017642 [Nyssa sinensis]|uniref:Uncharacterized protein n=1 Tax=Nyssa sinensis TaxID=561372 RepID=A0A5J4ZIM5_9ASTE|nr:hypothetical protein F0562_017642 [Nyssa sinensis]